MIPIAGPTYNFSNLQELYETAERLPEASRHPVYGVHREEDEWQEVPWRDSIWLDNGNLVGDVSASEDWYNVIQYGDAVESVAQAVEQYDGAIDVQGHVELSPSGHKMSGRIDFYGDTTIEPVDGDEINLGIKIRTGHSGYHALKYDVGAMRQVCSNGMMAFVSDMHFEQSHQSPLDYGIAQQAVDAVVQGTEEVENRLKRAREREFVNADEAILVLSDFGIDDYLPESPIDILRDCLSVEVDDEENPTLYDTYNAATRALTHETEEMPQHRRDEGLEAAARLLDYPGYGLPDADYIGQQAVDRRIEERIDNGDDDDMVPVLGSDLEEESEILTELRAARAGG